MKQKLLLFTVICMLALCLFALTANATEACTEHKYTYNVQLDNTREPYILRLTIYYKTNSVFIKMT